MTYTIELNKKALKFLEKQPLDRRTTLLKAISKLPNGDTKPLKNLKNLYRLRNCKRT